MFSIVTDTDCNPLSKEELKEMQRDFNSVVA